MSFLSTLTDGYEQLWKSIIRPERPVASEAELGPRLFTVEGKQNGKTRFVRRLPMKVNYDSNTVMNADLYVPILADEIKLDNLFPRPFEESCCLIYCHSQSANRAEGRFLVELLAPHNISVLLWDYAGAGDSTEKYLTLGVRENEELGVVFSKLQSDMGYDRIGLWGKSMGAAASLYFAQRSLVDLLILDSPFDRLESIILRVANSRSNLPGFVISSGMYLARNKIKEEAGFDISKVNPIEIVEGITAPGFFMIAASDSMIELDKFMNMYTLYGGEKTVKVIQSGNHNDAREDDSRLMSDVLNFILKHIKHQERSTIAQMKNPYSLDVTTELKDRSSNNIYSILSATTFNSSGNKGNTKKNTLQLKLKNLALDRRSSHNIEIYRPITKKQEINRTWVEIDHSKYQNEEMNRFNSDLKKLTTESARNEEAYSIREQKSTGLKDHLKIIADTTSTNSIPKKPLQLRRITNEEETQNWQKYSLMNQTNNDSRENFNSPDITVVGSIKRHEHLPMSQVKNQERNFSFIGGFLKENKITNTNKSSQKAESYSKPSDWKKGPKCVISTTIEEDYLLTNRLQSDMGRGEEKDSAHVSLPPNFQYTQNTRPGQMMDNLIPEKKSLKLSSSPMLPRSSLPTNTLYQTQTISKEIGPYYNQSLNSLHKRQQTLNTNVLSSIYPSQPYYQMHRPLTITAMNTIESTRHPIKPSHQIFL